MADGPNKIAPANRLPSSAEVEAAVMSWGQFLTVTPLEDLMASATLLDETLDGISYEIKAQPGLTGDFAIVVMQGVKVDTPHTHESGEVEVHFPLSGGALLSIGRDVIGLGEGDTARIIESGIPHFTVPLNKSDDPYIVGVLNIPGYNEANQIPVDLTNPPQDFNTDLYNFATAA